MLFDRMERNNAILRVQMGWWGGGAAVGLRSSQTNARTLAGRSAVVNLRSSPRPTVVFERVAVERGRDVGPGTSSHRGLMGSRVGESTVLSMGHDRRRRSCSIVHTLHVVIPATIDWVNGSASYRGAPPTGPVSRAH
jgi:hypothetical protein